MTSTLTDAELVVAGGPGTPVLLPTWAALDPAGRTTARAVARRSLLARGLLGHDGEGHETLDPRLRATLALRDGARVLVVALRLTPGGTDRWCAHVLRDVALLEQVSVDGVHRFALARAESLAGHVAAGVLHPRAADAVGPRPGATDPDLARVDVVSAVAGGSPRLLSLLSGPGGTWRLTRGEGASEHAEPMQAMAARGLLDAEVARLRGNTGA